MLEQVLLFMICRSTWNLSSIWARIGILFTDLTIQGRELGVGVEVNNNQETWKEERMESMNGGREGEKVGRDGGKEGRWERGGGMKERREGIRK